MPLEPHHVEIIIAMDQAWLKGGGRQPVQRKPITAEVFDAVFGWQSADSA